MRLALSLYFALLACNIITIVLILLRDIGEVQAILIGDLAIALVVLSWGALARRQLWAGLATLGPRRWYGLAVILGGLTVLAATGIVRLLVAPLGIERYVHNRAFLEGGYGWGPLVLAICVHPAIFEELAFRGIIQTSLSHTVGMRDAVIVSSLLFMVSHLMILSFPHLLLTGLVLGFIRVRSGSLYPCMVMHFTHNLFALLLEAGGI